MNEEKLNELIRHNKNLVRTAARLRTDLREAHAVICVALDLAEPVAGQHEDEPSEYILQADNLEDMRQLLVRQKEAADGRAVESWWRESALVSVDEPSFIPSDGLAA